MTTIKTIILEDGKLIHTESGTWVYTGIRGTFTGSKANEALAKAYGVDVNDVEVKVIRFRDGDVKALVCIEGLCELYDVELEESTPQHAPYTGSMSQYAPTDTIKFLDHSKNKHASGMVVVILTPYQA